MEYQQIAAAGFFPAPSTDALWVSWNGAGEWMRGLVFGTLLGPEATGPWLMFFGGVPSGCRPGVWGVGLVFLVSWLHRSCMLCVWGVWYGVVV